MNNKETVQTNLITREIRLKQKYSLKFSVIILETRLSTIQCYFRKIAQYLYAV